MSQTRLLFAGSGEVAGPLLAEGLLRRVLAEDDRLDEFLLDACTVGGHLAGCRPGEHAASAARRLGFDIADRRGRPLRASDAGHFDLLLALDRPALAALRGLPAMRAGLRSHLLLDFAPWLGIDELPMPSPGTAEELEDVIDTLELAVRGLLEVVDQSKADWRLPGAVPLRGKISSAT